MDQVKAIYENYNDEFSEMIYEHLDVIQNYAPYRELFPVQKKFDVKKIQGLKTKKRVENERSNINNRKRSSCNRGNLLRV